VDKDGVPLRKHLEQVEKQLGRTPEALIGPEFPELLSHLWLVFVDLSNTRSDKTPLTYSEIKSYVELMNETLLPRDIELIKRLDALWLEVMSSE
jgi:hypothetical protein